MFEKMRKAEIEVELIDSMGGDESVLAAMLVSTQGADAITSAENREAIKGRLNFLMKNRHGTPFEHGAMTFYVKAPIFIFREFHRHRIGWSYNEMSGRYMELLPEVYLPEPERKLVQVGKPGAYEFEPGSGEQFDRARASMMMGYQHAWNAYQEMLADGVAKEVARSVLPVGLMSQMFATCNPRSLMAFLSLRTDRPEATFPSKPMREIEMVAEGMEAAFAELWPITHEVYEENGRVAP